MSSGSGLWGALLFAGWFLVLPPLLAAPRGGHRWFLWVWLAGLSLLALPDALQLLGGATSLLRPDPVAAWSLRGWGFLVLAWILAESEPPGQRKRLAGVRTVALLLVPAGAIAQAGVVWMDQPVGAWTWVIAALLFLTWRGWRGGANALWLLPIPGAMVLGAMDFGLFEVGWLRILADMTFRASIVALLVADAIGRSRRELRRELFQAQLDGHRQALGPASSPGADAVETDRLPLLGGMALRLVEAEGVAIVLWKQLRTPQETLARQLVVCEAMASLKGLDAAPLEKQVALQALLVRLREVERPVVVLDSSRHVDGWIASELGVERLLAAGIRHAGQWRGVLVASLPDGRIPESHELDGLDFLVQEVALSLHDEGIHRRLLEESRLGHEVEIAARLQRSLLPQRPPEIPGLRIAAFMEPAREVGGDYFDFLPLSDERLLILIGDVAGKGLPAGMVVLIARTAAHVLARSHPSAGPADLVAMLDERLSPHLSWGSFMTLLALTWNGRERRIEWCGAGHEHLLLRQRGIEGVQRIRSGGAALGIRRQAGAPRTHQNLWLDSGDVIVLYTDGTINARDAAGEAYGLTRLEAIVNETADLSAERLLKAIREDLARFCGGRPLGDDHTLLILQTI